MTRAGQRVEVCVRSGTHSYESLIRFAAICHQTAGDLKGPVYHFHRKLHIALEETANEL